MPNPIQNNTETKFDKMHPSILIGPIVIFWIPIVIMNKYSMKTNNNSSEGTKPDNRIRDYI